jgi:hypothetical protein
LQNTYDIPDTTDMRRVWLRYVGDRWKDFKAKLVSKYIYGSFAGMSPCIKYNFIEQETWDEFVKSHTGSSYEVSLLFYQYFQHKLYHYYEGHVKSLINILYLYRQKEKNIKTYKLRIFIHIF